METAIYKNLLRDLIAVLLQYSLPRLPPKVCLSRCVPCALRSSRSLRFLGLFD